MSSLGNEMRSGIRKARNRYLPEDQQLDPDEVVPSPVQEFLRKFHGEDVAPVQQADQMPDATEKDKLSRWQRIKGLLGGKSPLAMK